MYIIFPQLGSCPGDSKVAYGILLTKQQDCNTMGGATNSEGTWISCHLDFCADRTGKEYYAIL